MYLHVVVSFVVSLLPDLVGDQVVKDLFDMLHELEMVRIVGL
jgi:hypothetical protein